MAVRTLTGDHGRIENVAGEFTFTASPPGVIGAAVIKAGLRSARFRTGELAGLLAVSPAVVRTWTDGTCPLFCVGYDRLCQLASALARAGAAVGRDAAELVLASQCDLFIVGVLRGFEDFAEVPPVEEEVSGEDARGLLRWALTGAAPDRFRAYAPARPLLSADDIAAFVAAARELSSGSYGSDLASFGTALVALAVS
jgi:hypothetical protein